MRTEDEIKTDELLDKILLQCKELQEILKELSKPIAWESISQNTED